MSDEMNDINDETALIKRLALKNALLRSSLKERRQASQREQAKTSRLLAEAMQRIEILQQEIAQARAQLRDTQNAQREHSTGYTHRQENTISAEQDTRAEPHVVSAIDAVNTEADTDTNRARPLRILIADPYSLVREGLTSIFAQQADMQIVGRVGSGRDAYELYSALRPDMLLMETDLPGWKGDLSGWKGDMLIASLSERYADCCILVLSHNAGEAAVESALRAGAKGYLYKNAPPEAIVAAARRVVADQQALAAHIQTAQAIRAQGQELVAGVPDGFDGVVIGI